MQALRHAADAIARLAHVAAVTGSHHHQPQIVGVRPEQLLQTWPYLTRMYTLISPHEMIEDPLFHPADLSSTVDNCLGMRCEHIDDCFVIKARREAQAADVVVDWAGLLSNTVYVGAISHNTAAGIVALTIVSIAVN